jgi:hypothetical protein
MLHSSFKEKMSVRGHIAIVGKADRAIIAALDDMLWYAHRAVSAQSGHDALP